MNMLARSLMVVASVLAAATPALAEIKAPPNAYSERLAKLSELQRNAALRRAVLDSGQYCKRVEWSARQQEHKNLVMWVARCNPGGDKAVYIGPDGSVQVRPCTDSASLKLPTCRVPAAAKATPAKK